MYIFFQLFIFHYPAQIRLKTLKSFITCNIQGHSVSLKSSFKLWQYNRLVNIIWSQFVAKLHKFSTSNHVILNYCWIWGTRRKFLKNRLLTVSQSKCQYRDLKLNFKLLFFSTNNSNIKILKLWLAKLGEIGYLFFCRINYFCPKNRTKFMSAGLTLVVGQKTTSKHLLMALKYSSKCNDFFLSTLKLYNV